MLPTETVPKCDECDYRYHICNYRCVGCHKYRELEPFIGELPTEIIYGILTLVDISVSPVNKALRKLDLPNIKAKILRNLPYIYMSTTTTLGFISGSTS